ncbi:MAG: transcriptional regulator [Gemmatimonadetes bacterium GWC2_71_9]|nr:MAG: transcriptional regulator [Gemmatimonadetes bacterium RIFCSPLOWO2_02_FULL_71_11]OGT95610.1 MAG: transcriptional regulator [Gemmatimonadetes bacterium GWC2_71_9]
MNVPLLDLKAQHVQIRDAVLQKLQQVVEEQAFILGQPVQDLEVRIAALSHAKHGIGVASGTDGLLLPLKALDLKPGDEVITSPFTFFATAGAIHNAGARPVFADIDPHTYNLEPAAVEAAITPRTRAILPVHLYGQMAALERLVPLARNRGVALIEDACQAIGARRKVDGEWRTAGELGTATSFSFFPSKNLGGWGDGGMVVTSDDRMGERVRRLRTHGGAKLYHHDEVGVNSRLDALQAAVLLAKLPYLQSWSEARRANAAWFCEALKSVAAVRTPVTDPLNEHIFHQYVIEAERRDALQAHLKAKGIGTAIYYPVPLHLQPCFAYLGYAAGQFPVAEAASHRVLALPVYPELTEAQQAYVAGAIREFYA